MHQRLGATHFETDVAVLISKLVPATNATLENGGGRIPWRPRHLWHAFSRCLIHDAVIKEEEVGCLNANNVTNIVPTDIDAVQICVGWSARDRAQRAHVDLATALRIKRSRGDIHVQARSVESIERAPEEGGIRFVEGEHGACGVQFTERMIHRS